MLSRFVLESSIPSTYAASSDANPYRPARTYYLNLDFALAFSVTLIASSLEMICNTLGRATLDKRVRQEAQLEHVEGAGF